jgi:mRNA-degrading endonuclease RelE of RelBE toxin-antitoxin system
MKSLEWLENPTNSFVGVSSEAPEEKCERLKGSPLWRMRVGDYRVVYEIGRASKRVIVLFIGHRRDVYDDFSRRL